MTVPEMVYRHAIVAAPGIDACTGRCWLCGTEIVEGIPRSVAIKPTFTDHEKAACPDASYLCIPCAFSLTQAYPVPGYETPKALRTFSHYVTGAAWEVLSKAQKARMREVLLDPPEEAWALVIAVSGQKHLLFRAPANLSRVVYRVQFEEAQVSVRRDRFREDLFATDTLYRAGMRKQDLETMRWSRYVERTPVLHSLFRQLQPYRGSPYLSLLVFLARKEEERGDGSDGTDDGGESCRRSAGGDSAGMATEPVEVGDVGHDRDSDYDVCEVEQEPGGMVDEAGETSEPESVPPGGQFSLFDHS